MVEQESYSQEGHFLSKTAVWGCALSVIGAFLFLISGYGYQWGWWELGTAFTRFLPGGAIIAAIGFIVSVVGLVLVIRRNASGMGYAVVGVLLGVGTVGALGYWLSQANSYPPIHDITTDTRNPPQFKAVIPLRADAPNPVEYEGAEIAAIQKESYPDIQTLYLNVPFDQAFDMAVKAAKSTSWKIDSINRKEGRIEATHTLAWYGFKDDIVIRVDSTESGSKIDARSVSRIGKGDLGVNAERIRDYLSKFEKQGAPS